MTERGYPTGDAEQVRADLSVEHAQTVGHFRAAQEISRSSAAGQARTEELRQVLIHYRALFSDLLGVAEVPLTERRQPRRQPTRRRAAHLPIPVAPSTCARHSAATGSSARV